MTHRGKRNPKSFIRRYLLKVSYWDQKTHETINLCEPETLVPILTQEYGYVQMSDLDVVRGEVLIDQRGQGSLQ